MSLKEEVIKNNIPIPSLEDDSLIQLFSEIENNKYKEKELIRLIIRTLLGRKKLHLLTLRR